MKQFSRIIIDKIVRALGEKRRMEHVLYCFASEFYILSRFMGVTIEGVWISEWIY
jgi:hypothetical protein